MSKSPFPAEEATVWTIAHVIHNGSWQRFPEVFKSKIARPQPKSDVPGVGAYETPPGAMKKAVLKENNQSPAGLAKQYQTPPKL